MLPPEVEYDRAQRRETEAVERRELDGVDRTQPQLGVHLTERGVERQEGDLEPRIGGKVGRTRDGAPARPAGCRSSDR
jgi:hypothetical protein